VLSALEAQVQEAAGGAEPSADGERRPLEPDRDSEPEPEPSAGTDDEAAPGGAEEGIHPAAPETYSDDPEGPTHSTRGDG
jgi:hypothetical protein